MPWSEYLLLTAVQVGLMLAAWHVAWDAGSRNEEAGDGGRFLPSWSFLAFLAIVCFYALFSEVESDRREMYDLSSPTAEGVAL